MINKLRDILQCNIKDLIWFQLIYKVCTFFIFVPIVLRMLDLVLKVTGYDYITSENILSFLINPLCILLLIIIILFMLAISFFDISVVIIIIDASIEKIKVNMEEVLSIAFHKSVEVFHFKNLKLAFLVLFLIPFFNIGFSSSLITTISIPQFIMSYINNKIYYKIVLICIIIFLITILLRWMYAIHYYILEHCSFKEAIRRSINLTKNNKIKDLNRFIIVQGVLYIGYIIFILLGILIIYLIYKIFKNILIIGSIFISMIGIFLLISLGLVLLISLPISYTLLSIMFYKHKIDKKENIKHIKLKKIKKVKIKTKRFLKYKVILGATTVIMSSIFTYNFINGNYDFHIEYLSKVEITAHRGNSSKYNENTMESFSSAYLLGSDWIELDIRKSLDDVLVVSHDDNLKRVTGMDINISDSNYKDLLKIKSNLVTLEEVMEWAKDKLIKINIEIKDNNISIINKLIELLHKYDYTNKYVVASSKYEILKEVKTLDKDIKTVYINSIAYGDLTNKVDADIFSIEEMSITSRLVKSIHNSGKEIYVWTVNNKEDVEKLVNLGVDNIITDDVELVKNTLLEMNSNGLILKYLEYVKKLLG